MHCEVPCGAVYPHSASGSVKIPIIGFMGCCGRAVETTAKMERDSRKDIPGFIWLYREYRKGRDH
jgi:hypothetical protein